MRTIELSGLSDAFHTQPAAASYENAATGVWRHDARGLRVSLTGSVPIRRIQVYGERCSGTHLISRLIERNFGEDVFTQAYGFKHWFVPEQVLVTQDVLVLTIARSPADWLRSLHRHPWHVAPDVRTHDFAAFIRTPWASFWDTEFAGIGPDHPLLGHEMPHERDPATGGRFPNPVALRTAKLRHWASLTARAHNVALLGYEALRDDPEGIIAALAAATGLRRTAFVPVESYKGQGYYRYERARYDPLGADDSHHVDRWLDPAVETLFAD